MQTIALYGCVAILVSLHPWHTVGVATGLAIAVVAALVWQDLPFSQLATFTGLILCGVLAIAAPLPFLALPCLLLMARAAEFGFHRLAPRFE